jgi:hypothetical protein
VAISQEITPTEKAFAFLALLVAHLPKGDYKADVGKWSTAVSNLRNKYGAKNPSLFRYLNFRQAPKSDSYSPEVSNFFTFLQFTDATEVQNPGYTKLIFKPSAQALLQERYTTVFSPEDQSIIQEMSQVLVDEVKASVPPVQV